MELLPGPGDVPHPRKWKPAPESERKELAGKETPSFLELFDQFVASTPDKVALTWFEEDGTVIKTFTYKELDQKSRAVARLLGGEWKVGGGERAVLIYPPGLEFLVAFVACLRAGVVAVPVYPPQPSALGKDLPKLQRIVADSGAAAVLTSSSYMNVVRLSQLRLVRWPGKSWHVTDTVKAGADAQREFPPPPSEIAFLQYTSGSTADPKGVMVGHTNMAHNISFVRRTLRLRESSRFFSWLPQYHDLGLIVAYLGTLSAGASGFYMSPVSFIRKPSLWLRLMSQLKITHTAAPNFALDLCCRKFDAEAEDAAGGLDLRPLESLLNAAEPVRARSIERWNALLDPYGWHPSSMTPCYGLAEHVVGVVGWGTKVIQVREEGPEGASERALHSSGHLATFPYDGRVVAVDPEARAACGEGVEGEIWVRSRHVTHGYWGKPDLTEQAFGAHMAAGAPGSDDGAYLRTGDLGIIVGDQLFVTGRIKDLIIIRGKNLHPEDVEKTVEEAWEGVRPGCVAAFSHCLPPGGGGDDVVAVVAEVRDGSYTRAAYKAATEAVRRAVVAAHGVFPPLVAFIPARTIPKTTSGKIHRGEAAKVLAAGGFKILNKAVYLADGTSSAAGEQAAHDAELVSGNALGDGVDGAAGGAPNGAGHENGDGAANGHSSPQGAGSVERAVLTLIRIQPEDVKAEDSLAALGLSSVDGMDVYELVKKRTGHKLTPAEVEVLTVGDLRAIDEGKGVPDLKARIAAVTGEGGEDLLGKGEHEEEAVAPEAKKEAQAGASSPAGEGAEVQKKAPA